MNVTELARRLKIPTGELKELLPRLGFDIGRKAIKVDDASAQKIIEKIKADPGVVDRLRQELKGVEEKIEAPTVETEKLLTVPAVITVRDFATMLNKPVASIIQELMKNGILANLNEQIDYETASIIAQDFGFKTVPQKGQSAALIEDSSMEQLLGTNTDNLQTRPPIVVVMGHVDHGKTMLLDTIRQTHIVDKEAGGITQHIGAYQVMVPTKEEPSSQPRSSEGGISRKTRDDRAWRTITFIDTPGHEAFTTMRSRGARIADIAIVVIAAEEGIKPQTEEVFKIVANAKLPFIVALNKIDKPEADIEKVKQQLAQKNLLPEDWGGKTICVPVSAKNGQGIDDLLEHLLLLGEIEKEHIRANPDREAIGTVIESHIDKGEGPVATVIIQTGTLHRGDAVQVGQSVGKIKAMKDFLGHDMNEAGPSTPAKILGLKSVPEVGDFLQATAEGESLKKTLKKLQHQQKSYQAKQSWQTTQTKKDEKEDKKAVEIILKTDTLGSQEAIVQSMETLATNIVKVTIIKKGLGNITDIDVLQAESTGAHIYGFNVKVNQRAEEMAKEKGIQLNISKIIYVLIESVQKEVEKLVTYKKEIVEMGRAKVLAIFRTERSHMIIGALITKGKAEQGLKVRIMKDKKEIGHGILESLQQGKQTVTSIPTGTECGLQIKGQAAVEVGNILEMYKEELVKVV